MPNEDLTVSVLTKLKHYVLTHCRSVSPSCVILIHSVVLALPGGRGIFSIDFYIRYLACAVHLSSSIVLTLWYLEDYNGMGSVYKTHLSSLFRS